MAIEKQASLSSRRLDNGNFIIHATQNETNRPRTRTIFITTPGVPTRWITVRQPRPVITIPQNQRTWSLDTLPDNRRIDVTSTGNWRVTVEK